MLSTAAATTALVGPGAKPTKSWWLDRLPADALPPALAAPPRAADVVVIGAGMTGCATAYWLKKLQRDGKSCVVLDARGVAGGATGRNGGHLWANPESEFEREVTKDVLKFIEEEGVECDLTNGGAASLVRVAPPSGVKYNDRADTDPEVESGDEWGDGPTWDAATCAANLRTEAFTGARVFPEAAQFYPAAVTAAMLRASGADYCAPARVLSIGEAAAGGKRVVTTDVGEIEAGVVVVATNAWAPELLPELAGQVSACRNQVIMTAPTAGAWEGVAALGVDGGARELYAIRRADGRICLGGARAIEPDAAVGNADDGSLSPEVGAYLRRYLAECFPKMVSEEGGGEVKIEEEWTGVLGFTPDGRPLCGRVRDGVFVAAGFCGHGMPRCFGAGKAIALMIDGRDDEVHAYVRGDANVARVLKK